MKKMILLTALLLGATAATQAGVHVGLGFSIPLGPPPVVYSAPPPVVYQAPAPVYTAPAPVYQAPPAVVYAPPPVVYGPPVVYAPPAPIISFGFGSGWGHRYGGWGHGGYGYH